MEMLSPSSIMLLGFAVPATLAIAAFAAPRKAFGASIAAFVLALLFSIVRRDAVTAVAVLLVSALGVVIVRFSRTYLDGSPGLARYLRSLLLTLSAATALVVTGDLLVLAAAWTATSLSLHQLLTFHGERQAALVAAHKKFLVSRLADACLLGALALVRTHVGSFELARISAWVESHAVLPLGMQVAAVLVVAAVALRSAQLPFHGWITQVMEAPTPVSALLHAGVVNIGGFVLIRLAPWMERAEVARTLLVAIGLVSTVVAALVMTTRVSVKVALAWSTCAQMGFMLVECGLGLWPLALLHIVAHSIYKAHAFLSAGSAVDEWKLRAVTPRRPPTTVLRAIVSVTVAVGGAGLALLVASRRGPLEPSSMALGVLVALSLHPLVVRPTVAVLLRGAFVVVLYVAAHALAERVVPGVRATASPWLWAASALAFVTLFGVKTALQLRPGGRFARWLHPVLFSGLYLDEMFTRLTFRVWPPRSAPEPADRPSPPVAMEVQA